MSLAYVYAVTSDLVNTIKVGYWKGLPYDLYTRYMTTHGRDVEVVIFCCDPKKIRKSEIAVHAEMSTFHIELELFEKSDHAMRSFLNAASAVALDVGCSNTLRSPIKGAKKRPSSNRQEEADTFKAFIEMMAEPPVHLQMVHSQDFQRFVALLGLQHPQDTSTIIDHAVVVQNLSALLVRLASLRYVCDKQNGNTKILRRRWQKDCGNSSIHQE